MSKQWYALRSKPSKEDALWREVRARGYEVFYPQIRVQPVNPRSCRIRPYFSGYMFIQTDLATTGFSAVTWIPYSQGLVSFDSEPSSVPDALILAIRRRVNEINAAGGDLFDQLHMGDEVTIQAGPFEGHQAIFDARLSGSERVRVLLTLLSQQQIPIVLSVGQIHRNKSLLQAGE